MSASSVGIALPSLEHAASAYAGSVDKPSSHSDDSSLSHGFEFEQRSDGDIRWVFAPVTLGPSITQSVSDIRSKILPFVRPRWKPQSLGHRVFEEGVSNRLIGFYEITGDPDEAEDIVLVRINGEGREAFIDSRTEILVMLTLHREGLSPPVYLVAENAICYGYIPGTTLSADDYQKDAILRSTAESIARFHCVPIPDPLKDSRPILWTRLEQWMERVEVDYRNELLPRGLHQVIGSLSDLRQEIEWLKTELGANGHSESDNKKVVECTAFDSDVVLCHNDPQPLNFILLKDGTTVLIDFEYAGKNYAAFDVSCFFTEFAGVHGPIDYSKYPSEAVQRVWITYYLEARTKLRGEDPGKITPQQVDTLRRHANKFALATHLLWTIWSLIEHKHSSIGFDYVEYGALRYKEYQRRKKMKL